MRILKWVLINSFQFYVLPWHKVILPDTGNDNPLQNSCLENPMNRVNWQATVHGVAESDKTEWQYRQGGIGRASNSWTTSAPLHSAPMETISTQITPLAIKWIRCRSHLILLSMSSKFQFPDNQRAQSHQSCPTPCNPMDHGLPGSSVHGILQARIQNWVTIFLLQIWHETSQKNQRTTSRTTQTSQSQSPTETENNPHFWVYIFSGSSLSFPVKTPCGSVWHEMSSFPGLCVYVSAPCWVSGAQDIP